MTPPPALRGPLSQHDTIRAACIRHDILFHEFFIHFGPGSRTRPQISAREAVITLLYKHNAMSYPEIAKAGGWKSHASVLEPHNSTMRKMEDGGDLAADIAWIESKSRELTAADRATA